MRTITIKKIVKEAAALRAQKQYQAAIAHIENNLASVDPDMKVVALLQAFYAAVEGGDKVKASDLAARLVELEPDLPSIQPYL